MSTLKSFLTGIGNAIREKKGTNEPINAKNFANEILSIQGGASLNLAYGETPPTDTSKIWLQCAEPSGIEVQNYLGECAVSNVANYGVIDNPVSGSSSFSSGYYSTCYIGNNQIAIVGYNHIRIFDIASKSYIADYTISVGTSAGYTNVLFKDNVLYFGYSNYLYSFDLTIQTLTNLYSFTYNIYFIFFSSNTEIDCLGNYSSNNYHYRYNISNAEYSLIATLGKSYGLFYCLGGLYSCSTIKVNNYVYSFYLYNGYSHYMKYNLSNNTIEKFTSYINFLSSIGYGNIEYSSVVYDNDRYIYIIGGRRYLTSSTYDYKSIIKYDTVNDTFEMLEQKLIGGKLAFLGLLIDNRIYMFGGSNDTSTSSNYGRPYQIDYFDLQYTLPQNNAIITIANYKDDNSLPLINTEKLKLNSNIASAYLGNADNLAEKVNAYYYESHKINDTYSSVTFDKNTIISNFENITNAINNNGGMLGCAFGGDSENSNYNLMISTYNDGIVIMVLKTNEPIMVGNIGSDGTFNESFGATPCTWLEGDTNTITFDNSYELNTIINAGVTLSTPQELIDLRICTFVINQGNGGYWKGINCDDYVEI